MHTYELKQTILCLDEISAGYNDGSKNPKPILKGVNLIEKDVVRPGIDATGQIIAVVGRSGRGKSTLFKVLTGLMKPMSGRVLITNSNPGDPESAKEVGEGDVGFVDQKYTLFRHKTVNQILMYALKNTKLTPEEKNKKIEEQLDKWSMTQHRDKYPCELSGGQRQRTAVIEQLLTSKHFMVFDEPFSGLDVGNIESVKSAFEMILSSDELNTIIFSTHDIRLAVELADVVYVIGYPEDLQREVETKVSEFNELVLKNNDLINDPTTNKKTKKYLRKENDSNISKIVEERSKLYSTIVQKYDLKEMGIAWTKFGMEHLELVDKIKTSMLNS